VARRRIAGRLVGDLESEILELLWSSGEWMTGREIWERLGGASRAYTTVVTVLGRLIDKGMVEKMVERNEGRGAYHYRAAGDANELTARAIGELLAATADPRAALVHFVADLHDSSLLADLADALERVRRE
jgi:predicted transcriptional regulator